MALFTCKTEDCANKDITFETLDDGGFMECGGCKAIVEPDANE